jgi:hypothetical protein
MFEKKFLEKKKKLDLKMKKRKYWAVIGRGNVRWTCDEEKGWGKNAY